MRLKVSKPVKGLLRPTFPSWEKKGLHWAGVAGMEGREKQWGILKAGNQQESVTKCEDFAGLWM